MPNQIKVLLSRSTLVLAGLMFSQQVNAVDFSISGFGTLGYTYENQEDLGYRRDITNVADVDQNGTFLNDSNLGVQLDATLNRQWSVTGQLLLEDRVSYDLNSLTELAFLRYSPSAHWDFRIGRIGVSAYAAADSRHIDYAHLWVRPPQELYGGIVFNSLDGIGATYYSNNPSFNWKATFEFGSNREKGQVPGTDDEYQTELDNVFSASLELAQEEWRWQLSYAYIGSLSVSHEDQIERLQQGVKALANNGTVATFFPSVSQEAGTSYEALSVDDDQINYLQAAALYFDGEWTLQSELFHIHGKKKSIPQGYGGYALLGHTFSSLTPYVMYGRFKPTHSEFELQQDWAAAGAEAALLQQGTLAGINAVRIDQSTWSLGLRWDVSPYVALKAQMDHVQLNPYGYGLWASDVERIDESRNVQVFTLNLNFIF